MVVHEDVFYIFVILLEERSGAAFDEFFYSIDGGDNRYHDVIFLQR